MDKNILKNLLHALLETRLQKLEKRTQEQIKDLKNAKIQYKKQGESINKLVIEKKGSNIIKKETFKNSLLNGGAENKNNKQNSNKLKLSPAHNKNSYLRKAITPTRPLNYTNRYMIHRENKNIINNNKYNYVKARYKDIPNINVNVNININNKKKYLTPEPKIKKRKKINKNNIDIKPKKLNLIPKKVNNDNNNLINEEKEKIKDINKIKREENNKKRTIISNIELEPDEIAFVLEELNKKGKEKKDLNSDNESNSNNSSSRRSSSNSSSSSSNSNSNSSSSNNKNKKKSYKIKNKEIINRFIEKTTILGENKIIPTICSFLDDKTKINFISCSRKMIRLLINYLFNIYNNMLKINDFTISNEIEKKINEIKKKYGDDDLDSPKYAFSLSKGSVKALDLLNDNNYNKIFKKVSLEPPLDEIILIYRIFFQLIDKEELCNITNDDNFWEKTRNYILENNKDKMGTFLREYISEFEFTNQNIYKIKKLVYGKLDKLKPLYFENICKTTGLIIFIIKDSFEYCGIIQNDKKTMPSIMINYLEYLQNNISRVKEYIDTLNQLFFNE